MLFKKFIAERIIETKLTEIGEMQNLVKAFQTTDENWEVRSLKEKIIGTSKR